MAYVDLGFEEIQGDDLLGEYLLGDDDEDELLGAARRRPANKATQTAIANRRAQTGVMVSQKQPRKSIETAIGFDTGAVLIVAGAATTVLIIPQKPMRVERLVCNPAGAPNFQINSLTVGTNNQFAAATALPAAVFTPNSVGIRLRGDTCQIGQTISVVCTNYSLAPARLDGAIMGAAIEY